MKGPIAMTVELEDTIGREITRTEQALVAGTFQRLDDTEGSRRFHQGRIDALRWVLKQAHMTESDRRSTRAPA